MTATFRFYGDLNDLLPRERRQAAFAVPTHHGDQSVKHLMEALGVPHTEAALILANGAPVDFGYQVQPGDRIAVYPPFSTLEPPENGRLRPPLPRPARFLLDNHLGRLARYLRLLGLDALYFNNQYDDAQLAQMAHETQRVLLSRDRGLLKRSQVVYGYCLRTKASRQQVIDVLRRYRLRDEIRPWTRCLRCNGLLAPAAKADILARLAPKTQRYFEEFQMCRECGQIYWQGSHFGKLQAFVEQVTRAAGA